MKPFSISRLCVTIWALTVCYSFAQPPAPGAGKKSPVVTATKQVHMGVGVAKPGGSVYAQLPELPKGCGFILQSVIANGPAAKAGLNPMDIIWKLDGQLLINENQMLVLLSHKKPGDQIAVSYFRSGKPEQLNVTLDARGNLPPHPGELVMTPPLPGSPAMPMRVVSYEDRSASISDKSGVATLMYREGKPWLHVENSKGEETFNGYISSSTELAMVPASWRTRLPVLKRSLEESVRLRKLPRVRRIPTPKQRIASETP